MRANCLQPNPRAFVVVSLLKRDCLIEFSTGARAFVRTVAEYCPYILMTCRLETVGMRAPKVVTVSLVYVRTPQLETVGARLYFVQRVPVKSCKPPGFLENNWIRPD